MAAANGTSSSDLKQQLLTHGKRFDFFQAIRLLNRIPGRRLRIRPDTSLGFPASDIANIQEKPDEQEFLITATFLGLYGSSSPLPTFYSKDLLGEDSTVARDFIDILHHQLFDLLVECWKKYRLFIQIVEVRNQAPLEMLYALCGLPATSSPDENSTRSYTLLRYAGLLGSHPRSALGLATVLSDSFGGIPVDVIPFVARAVKIPLDQQMRLGVGQNVLGQDSFVGEEFIDRQGKFRVRIGPIRHDRFRSLLRGGEGHQTAMQLIKSYLTDPLDYDIELILEGAEMRPSCLGGSEWSSLGLDTALYTGDFQGDLSVVFPPDSIEGRAAA